MNGRSSVIEIGDLFAFARKAFFPYPAMHRHDRKELPMKIHMPVAALLTAALLATAVSVNGDPAPGLSLKVTRVAHYKNGIAFFNTAAVLPDKAVTIKLGRLPVPVYGTFWVGYGDKVKVRELVSSLESVEDTVPFSDIAAFLSVNTGRKAVIRTGSGEKDVVTGTILGLRDRPNDRDEPNPYFMDSRPAGGSGRYGASAQPGIVLVKTDRGVTALAASSISRVDLEGGASQTAQTVTEKRPGIRLELDRPAGGEKIEASFLAKGVTWAPGYTIDLTDPKNARFTAKATIINEVMDFDRIDCELVTGFPNIPWSDVVGPEAMSENLAAFLNSLGRGRSENRRDHGAMLQNQASFYDRNGDDAPFPLPGYNTAADGSVSEDLFMYPVERFSLRKGETATIPLFTAVMPCAHIYTWHIDDFVDNGEQYRSPDRSGEREGGPEPAEEIWHSCRLTNNLKMPLTTAPVEFTNNGRFTGQDLCSYTAPGAETTIRIGKALNVSAEQAEVEADRKRGAAEMYGYNYDLVKVKGEMKVRNGLDKPITLEITKNLTGEVLLKTPEAKDVVTAKGLRQVNPRHVLTWRVEVKPGADFKASYTYQVYIRN
jgi:hypothetical protein